MKISSAMDDIFVKQNLLSFIQNDINREFHYDPHCRICKILINKKQSSSIPPYPNPYSKDNPWKHWDNNNSVGGPEGNHWYHGTKDPNMKEIQFNHKRDTDPDRHWNTDLGVHFSSLPGVSKAFTKEYTPGGGRQPTPGAKMAHATLHMKNPINFKNEEDFSKHAVKWAHSSGHRFLPEDEASHHNFIQGFDVSDQDKKRDKHINEVGKQISPEAAHWISRIDKEGINDSFGGAKPSPAMYDRWLGLHPDRKKITDNYRKYLQKNGYDGVVYGNSYEPPFGHKSAIVFPGTPVKIHKWENVS